MCGAIMIQKVRVTVYGKGDHFADLALCMKITFWVGFERFLNSVSTVSRKAYCAGVRSLHSLGSQ